MLGNELDDVRKNSIVDLIDDVYLEAENKNEIDFWTPLTNVIIESIELRGEKDWSQNDLADSMGTRQSVISRFENMGRKPSYEFLSRIAVALGHSLGMTLYGDFMAIVSLENQTIIKQIADERQINTQTLVQDLLNQAIENVLNLKKYACNKNADNVADILSSSKEEDPIVGSGICGTPEGREQSCESIKMSSVDNNEIKTA